MRISNGEDAKSVVRKYFLGTRTFHGKITSLAMEQNIGGPDEKGAWKVNRDSLYLRTLSLLLFPTLTANCPLKNFTNPFSIRTVSPSETVSI